MNEASFFQAASWAWLLLAWLLVAGLLRGREDTRARRLRQAFGARDETARAPADADGQAASAPSRHGAFHAAGLLLILACMQPSWGVDRDRVQPRGGDVVVCLDVSRSMLARDLLPDRLRAAHRALRALAEHARGDRLALVVFAGDARPFVPLTDDRAVFAELVALAEPSVLRVGGTDLGAALDAARTLFPTQAAADGRHDRARTVVLLTDGEDHGERGLRAARALAADDVVVHAVGFGSARGSKIVVPTADGERFLTDADGREVVSALQAGSLQRLAAAGGGQYRSAASAEVREGVLIDLYEEAIRPRTRRHALDAQAELRENRYQWPLLGAVLLLLLEAARRARTLP